MKLQAVLTMFFLICLFGKAQSQTEVSISSISVNYKQSNTFNPDTSGIGQTFVLPEATINLSSTSGISKIHLKIINRIDNSVLYTVNYNINSSAVVNEDGLTLFQRDNNVVHINSPNSILLNTYSYELITEDLQGNLSLPFSEIR